MTKQQRINNLSVPEGMVDVILDTDAYNEVDDQYAIAYLLKSKEKLNVKAIYAAPFSNGKVSSVQEGMEASYNEIKNILKLMGEDAPVFKGSKTYLPDIQTPVFSDAARDLADRVEKYSPKKPLYIIAIGAITNIASAYFLNPKLAENAVVIWLGGNARHFAKPREYNLIQDVNAARVVMGCGVPFVQVPVMGVVSGFTISGPELEYWLKGKNPLCDYLATRTIEEAEHYAKGTSWTRIICDVCAVAWLLNDEERFMDYHIVPTLLPGYDFTYDSESAGLPMQYVYHIKRDNLMTDMIEKITK